MSAIDNLLYNPNSELQDYIASGWTRVMSRHLDSYQEVRTESGQARFNEESIFRIPPAGHQFLQDIYLVNRFSPTSGGDGTEAYAPALGLNCIDRLSIWSGGRKVWSLDDMTGPYLQMTTYQDSNEKLPHTRILINDVDAGTRNTQATGSGVTTYLKLDSICSVLSHPLPLWMLHGPLEIRIRYKPVEQCVVPGATGTPTFTFNDSHLQVNFIQGNDNIRREAERLVRSGQYSYFAYEYLHNPQFMQPGSSNYRFVLSNLVDKNVMKLWFTRRETSDIHLDPFAFKAIQAWNLKSSGRRIDNQNRDWTSEFFNNWYIDSLHIPNLSEIRDQNKYFICYSEEPKAAFANQAGEIAEFHGAYSFRNVSDATLEVILSAAVTDPEQIDVNALVPCVVQITPQGRLEVIH